MDSCVFCGIIAKTIPSHIVYETDEVLAFLDIHPVHPGHVLVVPKQHAETLTDLSQSALATWIQAVPTVARALQVVTGCEGYNLLQNNGAAAGQVIPHVHLHVIPRWSTDGLRHWPNQSMEPQEGARLAEQMRSFIQS